jgi:hypothetical protein
MGGSWAGLPPHLVSPILVATVESRGENKHVDVHHETDNDCHDNMMGTHLMFYTQSYFRLSHHPKWHFGD